MESRRKARREAVEAEHLAKERALNPKLDARFADLKRGLTAVSDSEWENLPEVGDLTRKRRKQNLRLAENGSGKSYAISDTILASAAGQNKVMGELDEQQMNGGYETPANGGAETDLVGIGQARDRVLSLQLDQLSKDAANGTSTSIDPKGYMTALNSLTGHSDAQIGDIKRARQLLDSVIKTNPKHGPGWIAAASLEVHAKKMVAARRIIAQGCEQCPKNEDVWFHAAELNTPENAKVILAKAVQHLPQSVKIWMKAASLETDVKAKKRVLRKGELGY
jgi:pre-mRNA-processing factor 6